MSTTTYVFVGKKEKNQYFLVGKKKKKKLLLINKMFFQSKSIDIFFTSL